MNKTMNHNSTATCLGALLRSAGISGLMVALAMLAVPSAVLAATDEGTDDHQYSVDESDNGAPQDSDLNKAQATFSCQTSVSGIVYCTYTGPVKLLYINSGRLILLYPDSQITAAQIQSEVEASGYESYWNVDISQFSAFGFQTPPKSMETSDPEQFYALTDFGRKAYAMMMAAQMSGQSVNVQFRGGNVGYLKIERMWQ